MKKDHLRTMKLFIMMMLTITGCVWGMTGTASAQVTNDNSHYYYESTDQLQIVKTAQDLSGFEVLYVANDGERVSRPEYHENRVFFWSTEAPRKNTSFKLKSIDVNTKEVRTVAEEAQFPTIIKGKVYLWKYTAPNKFHMDLWMCNLDGTGLKKTSATSVAGLSPSLFELNGKVVFVRLEGGLAHNDGTGVFCKVNLDGSGYSTMFRKNLKRVNMFDILFTHEGYIYYKAQGNLERDDSQEGIYRAKADGSSSKQLFDFNQKSADIVAPYGDKLYFFHYMDGLCTTDLAGNNRKVLNFKPRAPLDIRTLSTGFLSFNGLMDESSKKKTDIMYSLDPNNPKIVDLANFMPESPAKDLVVGVTLLTAPNKVNYIVGETFDRTGLLAVRYTGGTITHYNDQEVKFVLADGTVITEGYTFNTPGIYEVKAYCGDSHFALLDVVVTKAGTSKITDKVPTGWYKVSSLNVNVGVNANGGVVISNANPQAIFLFTHEGDMKYTIQTADGKYVSTTNEFKNLMPLNVSTKKYLWTLTEQLGETYSLRPYPKQTMTVNVTGSKTADGTALMLWNTGVKTVAANSKFTLTPAIAPLKPETAIPSASKLSVNGTIIAVEAYLINENNYIKVRDLAAMINGTSKNFNVEWNDAMNTIDLQSSTAYAIVGGEMIVGNGESKDALPSTSTLYLDGAKIELAAYLIGGNNYFKLRDVMELFKVQVGWDQATGTATLTTD